MAWLTSASLLGRTAAFLSLIVVARHVTPAEFGIFRMVADLVIVMELFRDIGMARALQTYSGDRKMACDVTFHISNAAGLVMFALALIFAGDVARFYNTPEVESLLRVMAITIVLNTLTVVPRVIMQLERRWDQLAISEFAPQLLGAIVLVVGAINGYAYWSYAASVLIRCGGTMALAYWINGWRPRKQFSWPVARELFAFGKWAYLDLLLYAGVITFADSIYLGRFQGAHELGLYGQANNLVQVTFQVVVLPLDRIAIVMVADANRENKAYAHLVQITYYVALLMAPLYAFLMLFPELIIGVVLSERWIGAAPILQVLALNWFFVGVFTTPLRNYFLGTVRPKLLAYSITPSIIFIFVMYWLSGGSYNGVQIAWLFLASRLIHIALSLFFMKADKEPLWPLFARLWKPLLCVGVAAPSAWYLSKFAAQEFVSLLIATVVFFGLYGAFWTKPILAIVKRRRQSVPSDS
ncbi:MAG: oligosaccharide flippase family protein [Armatimonadetes bacterium]|nr:oligosaccharide flippase family protein [Armatimonadota bacterium]